MSRRRKTRRKGPRPPKKRKKAQARSLAGQHFFGLFDDPGPGDPPITRKWFISQMDLGLTADSRHIYVSPTAKTEDGVLLQELLDAWCLVRGVNQTEFAGEPPERP